MKNIEPNFKELYLNHVESEVETTWNDGYDFTMTAEYTADDYNVYLCKYEGEDMNLNENIYYYANNMLDILKEKMAEGLKIFCDDEIYEDCHIDSEWEALCEDAELIEWDDEEDQWVEK